MKHLIKFVVCAGLFAGLPWLPAGDQPALPAGHPDISKPQAKAGELPAGHPDISKMHDKQAGQGEMPSGQLPSGHPNLDQLMGASTQPAGPGKLNIRTSQGTKGGPAIAGDPVSVEIYIEDGKILKTIQTKLDDKGQAAVEIPLTILCQPVVRIMHAGISFEGVCKVMDRKHIGQDLEMTLYEATDQQPPLSIGMRHVLVRVVPEGLHITEMLAITNPSDKAWIGTEVAGGTGGIGGTAVGGKRMTFCFPLSIGARNLNVEGAPEGALELRDGRLLCTLPIFPGTAEMQMHYIIPVAAGKADLTITAPVPVGKMFVFIPDDGSNVTTTGLDSLGVRKTGDGNKRGYQAGTLKAGQEARLSFTGLKLPAEPIKKSDASPSVSPAASSSHLPQIAAGVGGVVILGSAAVLLVKSPKKPTDRI